MPVLFLGGEREPDNVGVVVDLLVEIRRLVAGVRDLADADHITLLFQFAGPFGPLPLLTRAAAS